MFLQVRKGSEGSEGSNDDGKKNSAWFFAKGSPNVCRVAKGRKGLKGSNGSMGSNDDEKKKIAKIFGSALAPLFV